MEADWFAEGPDRDWFQVHQHLAAMEHQLQSMKDNGFNMHAETVEEIHGILENHVGWLLVLLPQLRRHHHTRPTDD